MGVIKSVLRIRYFLIKKQLTKQTLFVYYNIIFILKIIAFIHISL